MIGWPAICCTLRVLDRRAAGPCACFCVPSTRILRPTCFFRRALRPYRSTRPPCAGMHKASRECPKLHLSESTGAEGRSSRLRWPSGGWRRGIGAAQALAWGGAGGMGPGAAKAPAARGARNLKTKQVLPAILAQRAPARPTQLGNSQPPTAAGQASNGLVSHGVWAASRRAAACIVVPRLPVDVSAQPLAGFSAWRTSAPASRRWSRTVPLRCSPLLRTLALQGPTCVGARARRQPISERFDSAAKFQRVHPQRIKRADHGKAYS